MLKKITNSKGVEIFFFFFAEGMLRLVKVDSQVIQQRHIGLKVNEIEQVLRLAKKLGWHQSVVPIQWRPVDAKNSGSLVTCTCSQKRTLPGEGKAHMDLGLSGIGLIHPPLPSLSRRKDGSLYPSGVICLMVDSSPVALNLDSVINTVSKFSLSVKCTMPSCLLRHNRVLM